MNDILPFLGIYTWDIETAIKKAENACFDAGIDLCDEANDLDMDIFFWFLKHNGDWENITTSIIEAYYYALGKAVEQNIPEATVTYYVNGAASSFYIELPEESEDE